jgi:hypothetical protein
MGHRLVETVVIEHLLIFEGRGRRQGRGQQRRQPVNRKRLSESIGDSPPRIQGFQVMNCGQ